MSVLLKFQRVRQRARFSLVARELAELRVLRKFHLDERRAVARAVIASQRVGAKRRPMTGSAKQSRAPGADWIASSQVLLAMTAASFNPRFSAAAW
jgi:hypothetical protein